MVAGQQESRSTVSWVAVGSSFLLPPPSFLLFSLPLPLPLLLSLFSSRSAVPGGCCHVSGEIHGCVFHLPHTAYGRQGVAIRGESHLFPPSASRATNISKPKLPSSPDATTKDGAWEPILTHCAPLRSTITIPAISTHSVQQTHAPLHIHVHLVRTARTVLP